MVKNFIDNYGRNIVLTFFFILLVAISVITFYTGFILLKYNKIVLDLLNAKELKSSGEMIPIIQDFVWKTTQGKKIQVLTTEKDSHQGEESDPPIILKHEFRSSTWSSDYEAMKKNIQYYNEIHPFIYSMSGGLKNNGKLVNLWSRKQKRERTKELRALNPKVLVIPTIFRWENPKEKISENIGMKGRSDIRDFHIKTILNEIETYNYDGIDIDYEGMSCDKKEKFEEFIVLLSRELKKRKKILSVAVHPKTTNPRVKEVTCEGLKKPILRDFVENWRGPMTHDYKFLAKYADRVKIMAYELHPRKYRDPGPGPQAPNTWLVNIIEYAITRIPTQKLYMAIPTYGYDWALNCKARARAVYYSTVQEILDKKHKKYQPTNIEKIFEENKRSSTWGNLKKFIYIHRNKIYEDPTLWYRSNGCDRVAFYMNREAFEAKMNLLRSYNLGGFSFWQLLTDNDPGINEYLTLMLTGKEPPFEKVYNHPKNLTYEQRKKLKEIEKNLEKVKKEEKNGARKDSDLKNG